MNINLSDTLVRALGWALAHSLWQGVCLALMLLVILPRLRTARQRYRLAYGTLMAIFAAAMATFCWVFEPAGTAPTTGIKALESGPFFTAPQQTTVNSFWETMTDWLESHHVVIVLLWLLGFVFFLFRLGAGLWQVHKLQTQYVEPVDAIWQHRIQVLSHRLGIRKAIALCESALIRSPMAIGWLKPVILLPIGLINRLSPAEVEAILAHELAHIARRDWIFNLLQAFVEALFYYHPAVWWVSAIVRSERENCCDDTALAATGNPLVLAKALVQVQELAAPAPMFALGIGGSSRRKPLLLERIRRILNQPQQKSQVMEKLTATAILLVLLAFIGLRANTPTTVTAALSQLSEWPGTFWSVNNTDNQMMNDSVPKPKTTRKITRTDDNGKVELEMNNGEVTRLNIDGKEIPASEWNNYEDLTLELQRNSAPPPPAPPVPPMPPAPPVPPMPPMPPFPGMAPMPPMPPLPPMPPMPSTLSTITDQDGNVIIKLEKDGKPVEIKVKDGEVWINGKKMEKGESIPLPGMGFHYPEGFNWNFDHNFDFDAPAALDAPAVAFSFSAEDRARWEERAAEMREEAKRYSEEYRAIMEQRNTLSKEDREKMEKELEVQQKDWEKEAKKWEKEQEKWQKDQEKWQAKQEQWQAEHQKNWNQRKHGGDFQQALKVELMREKRIADPTDYSFQLNAKSLKINGKKQPDDIHQKYLDLYEKFSGNRMEKGDNYTIEERN